MAVINSICIDPGTNMTRFSDLEMGEILEEPTLIAVEHGGEIAAVGTKARELIETIPGRYIAIRPMKDGMVADFEYMRLFMAEMLKKYKKSKSMFFMPKTILAIPAGLTDIQRQEMEDVIHSVGVKDVAFIDKPIASAIGANADVMSPQALFTLNIGAGITEAAVICLNNIISYRMIRVGSESLDEAISSYVRRNFGVWIGRGTAEALKKKMGFTQDPLEACICGKNLATGLPITVKICAEDIAEALKPGIAEIADSIKQVLFNVPAEFVTDISQEGILLTGGGAKLIGIREHLEELLELPVKFCEDPERACIRGMMSVMGVEKRALLERANSGALTAS